MNPLARQSDLRSRVHNLVLLVDDDNVITRFVGGELERAGYTVLTANDGETALDIVQEWRPDLIILDVMMPGLSGWEVLRCIRRSPGVCATPVIVATSLDEQVNAANSWVSGCDWHLPKPFALRDLLLLMERILTAGEAETRQARASVREAVSIA